MATTAYSKIIKDGLWTNNPSFVQLLGMCPLLAISSTVINGLGMGLITALTLVVTNVSVSLSRGWVRPEIRIPVFVVLIAAVVTVIQLGMNAYFHELYLILGIFIPLIVTNCFVLGRAEAFAFKHDVLRSALDGLMNGLGFTYALVLLGGMRELLGHGTLFSGAQMMFGEAARGLTITAFPHYHDFLLAILPPGAFFGLAFLIALKNGVDRWLAARVPRPAVEPQGVGATA